MRFMILVKADKDSEAGILPDEKILREMGAFNEELVKAGVMLAGEGLHPTSKGSRVRFSGGRTTVTDGPFAETKELIAGFWLWNVKSKEEAIEWLKRSPFQETEIEIRQLFEADDFGEAFTPELREQEERVRAKAAARSAAVQPYLFFQGRCEEAITFYQRALGAEVEMLMRFKDNPQPPSAESSTTIPGDKIMHASLRVGNAVILASDGECSGKPAFGGFSLSLTLADVAAVERAFHALADGGKVLMPPGRTFWSPCFGMVTDRFGVGWMIGVQG